MSTLEWLQLVMGTSFVLAGLIAWRARPGNRTGPIMALYGSFVLAGFFLQRADVPVAVTLGILIADFSAFVFMYLLLAFPTCCGSRSSSCRAAPTSCSCAPTPGSRTRSTGSSAS